MGRGGRRGGNFRNRGGGFRRNTAFRDFDNDKYGDRRENGDRDRDRNRRSGVRIYIAIM